MKITSVTVKKIDKENSRMKGIASVVIDECFENTELINFLADSSIGSCVVLIDEFEKLYCQNCDNTIILQLLDGASNSHHLYILTCNNTNRINTYLLNRPSRIYYRKEYDSIPDNIIHEIIDNELINKETKELINALSYIYNLNTLDMQGLVRNSLNEKGLIDKALLRRSCRDYYQFDNNGNLPTLIYNKQPEYLKKPKGDNSKWAKMVYAFENLNPYQFLKAKYKGAEPTDRDKRLIENLLVEQKLNPGVVNVLIAYVLKINNEQLKKSYVETIAGQWKRLNIETVEEAMRITEKEHKKTKAMMSQTTKEKESKKQKTPSKDVPAWFSKEIEKVDPDDYEKAAFDELDKILEELV